MTYLPGRGREIHQPTSPYWLHHLLGLLASPIILAPGYEDGVPRGIGCLVKEQVAQGLGCLWTVVTFGITNLQLYYPICLGKGMSVWFDCSFFPPDPYPVWRLKSQSIDFSPSSFLVLSWHLDSYDSGIHTSGSISIEKKGTLPRSREPCRVMSVLLVVMITLHKCVDFLQELVLGRTFRSLGISKAALIKR